MKKNFYEVGTSGNSICTLQFSNVVEDGKPIGRNICISIEEDGTTARAFLDRAQVARMINQLSALKAILGSHD